MNPPISIITAAYNAEKYLEETIRSVQNQTFQDWEYIIADNGSIDGTRDIILSYLSDKRIKLIIVKEKGKTKARNAAFQLSKGEFIANIDSDDLWSKEKLEKQYNVLRNNENVGLVYTGINLIDENSNIFKTHIPKGISEDPLLHILTKNNPITHSSILMRRNSFSNNKYQYEEFEYVDELIIYLNACKSSTLFYLIKEPLTSYRIHSASEYSQLSISDFYFAHLKVYEFFFNSNVLPIITKKVKNQTFANVAYLCALKGLRENKDFQFSIRLLYRAISFRYTFIFRIFIVIIKIYLLKIMRSLLQIGRSFRVV